LLTLHKQKKILSIKKNPMLNSFNSFLLVKRLQFIGQNKKLLVVNFKKSTLEVIVSDIKGWP